jgi:hypothetical protein
VEKMGMGILFTGLTPQDSAAIREYVEDPHQDLAATPLAKGQAV